MTNEAHEPHTKRTHEPNTSNQAHEPNGSGEPRAVQRRSGPDAAATARRARFGTLPDRVRPEDTVETRPATPRDPARDAYNPDEWLVRYCL
ncbi:hypothetical protein [Streptomyces cellostaticus]|uniref:hypothetical protein n=1 Tax=Streptomyces TaxID=1883 RepID=UPI002026434C|nr:hypothetical protein [Streptomyces cellostaticus]